MTYQFFCGFLGLFFLIAPSRAQENNGSHAVAETLKNYAAAVESKNIAEVEKYVVTSEDFTIFEGGHINWGWPDYRDNHLAPELKSFLEFQYNYEEIKARVLGDMAYATLKYNIYIKMKEREISGEGLATAVLLKKAGQWKIQHMHTSKIPKREH